VVLGDLYREFTWDRLNDLFTMLAAGAPLIALHRNRVSRRASGIALDLGPFVAALEYAADVRAHIVGKPSRQFFDLAVASLDLAPARVLMVGDDIESDIGGALGAGLAAVQVRTGKYRPRDEDHPTATPAGRIDSIADLAPWLTRGEAR
jgi:HAD superfamily hydrolase (TIGR01458 family)